jgi:hypothetical protein
LLNIKQESSLGGVLKTTTLLALVLVLMSLRLRVLPP